MRTGKGRMGTTTKKTIAIFRSNRQVYLSVALGVCVLFATAASASQPRPIGMVLDEADAMRSDANRSRFAELLEELNHRVAEASEEQSEQISYLNAYRTALAGSYKQAIAEAVDLFQRSKNADMRFRAAALALNGMAVQADYTGGLRQLESILPLVDQVKNIEVRRQGLGAGATLYNQVGQYELAIPLLEKIRQGGGLSPRTSCFTNYAELEALQGLGRFPEDGTADRYASKCEGNGEKLVAVFIRSFIARSLKAQGKIDEASRLLERLSREAHDIGYPAQISQVDSLLAEVRLLRHDLEGALRASASAVAAGEKTPTSAVSLVSAYKTQYQVAETRGDTIRALAAYKLYMQADKQNIDQVKAKELAYQIVRHETQQKAQQISLLSKQNEVLRLQQQVDKQSAQNSRLMVLLMLLVCGFVGYWAYKVKRVQISLKRWAETDALTQVSNRHSFSQTSRNALTDAARDGEEVAMVMFDLDHFKAINDRFGHGTGDWVLKEVAEVCRSFCRRVDQIGRLGGEEFAFLLRGYDARSAVRLSDDCRARLASIDTAPSGHSFVVTGSFGVTTTALSGYDLTRLLSHADNALYRAKREGRNRVYLYEPAAVSVESQFGEVMADNVVPLKAEPAAWA